MQWSAWIIIVTDGNEMVGKSKMVPKNAIRVGVYECLGEEAVHKEPIQKILAMMKKYDLKVWFVWIPREGMLKFI